MFAIPAVTEYKLNVRSLTISVYRAIRMGWTPEVIYGQDWPKSHYDPLVNKPAVKLKSARDFNTLAHRYSKVTGSIYRLAREEQTTEQWFAMYRKIRKSLMPNFKKFALIPTIADDLIADKAAHAFGSLDEPMSILMRPDEVTMTFASPVSIEHVIELALPIANKYGTDFRGYAEGTPFWVRQTELAQWQIDKHDIVDNFVVSIMEDVLDIEHAFTDERRYSFRDYLTDFICAELHLASRSEFYPELTEQD